MRRPRLVALGASLGGLHAVSRILRDLPASFPAAVAIVQHRASGADGGRLAALLQDGTPFTVIEVDDKMAIEAGTVYLAPADYHLLVEGSGSFALSVDAPIRAARPSIDAFFLSAAECFHERVVGVVLTGASADGAEGLAAIKAHGGGAIVQDPATAACATMPAAALAATAVDYVLPLAQIGAHLAALAGSMEA
jgi:two-component system, chemotaxis family, protein-glutamate methylesterase/glutaminase